MSVYSWESALLQEIERKLRVDILPSMMEEVITKVAVEHKIADEMALFRDQIRRYFKTDEFERRVLEIVFGANSTIMKTQIEKVREEIKQLISTPFPEPTRSGQPWTDGEVAQLEREVSKLVSKLAGMSGRTPKAIESKCRALGLLGYKH